MSREHMVHPIRHGAEQSRKVPSSWGTFPLSLPRWCIRLHGRNNAVVLDPFMGTGTTLVAAELEGASGIGIDIDPSDSVVIGRRRLIEANHVQLDLADVERLPIDRASHCLSPAWSISIVRQSASRRYSYWSRLAAKSNCRVRRPAVVNQPIIPVIGTRRVTLAKPSSTHSVATTTWLCRRVPVAGC